MRCTGSSQSAHSLTLQRVARYISCEMSASELIEQWKALPPKEREAFARLLRQLEKAAAPAAGDGNGGPGSASWPDFGARLKRIYGNKVTADSQSVISYARGDW